MVRHVTALCTSGGGRITIPTLTGHIFLPVLNTRVGCLTHVAEAELLSRSLSDPVTARES